MMSKKDYEKAAWIAQQYAGDPDSSHDAEAYSAVIHAFTRLFQTDNPRFNETRFRCACVPGANVKARG